MKAERFRGAGFVADVDFGGGVIAGEDYGEAWGAVVEGAKPLDARAAFGEDFVADAVAVEEEGHLTNLADGAVGQAPVHA